MSILSGWLGTPSARNRADIRDYLTKATAPASLPGTQTPAMAAGDDWLCFGPSVADQGDVAVALRARPIWRTSEARILKAASPAAAVAEAYRLHGGHFLDILHGAFAVVVLDRRTRTAILAVDRMGIESLAYSMRPDGLLFATSAETVARGPDAVPTLRPQAILSYLFFHMIPSPETVFEGVYKIPPATAVELRNGAVSERRYWQPVFESDGDFTALKQRLHESLATGVRETQPDATTGAFLSGGLDSSTVAGCLTKIVGGPVKTFSMGFGFEDYDELRYARLANTHFGNLGHEYQVQPRDIVELFPTVARTFDEPFGNASALPTHCCARFARENGSTHLLAGDGGDEIFAGNKRYAEQRVFERYQEVPAFVRRGLLEPMLKVWPPALTFNLMRKARNYVAQANTPMPDRSENWNLLRRLGFAQVLHPEFAARVDVDAPMRHMRAVYDSAPETAFVNRMLHYDWRFTLADNDLRKVGRMCELAGVRVSYPMLHPDVIDLATQVPPDLMMRGTQLRTFYKRAMQDFLPQEIIHKSKHGFGLPFGLWLERSPEVAALINGNLADLRGRGVIRPEFIDRLLHLHGQEDARYYGVFIWLLAMLEQWFKEHRLAP